MPRLTPYFVFTLYASSGVAPQNFVQLSRCYKKQPLVIQGAGAGNATTAASVLADILDIQDLFP
ncbi:hypothetical protein KY290_008677 [Solanum tuberosum]|uniref:Homoserine dehydrogenase catalytic domain-containing protein n=1 Tax=Solanum tuberosum TaxID=4113 RepID=A0ABQ7W944_SOLTU|nr:hypothetical protein KY290_008677 [Solanum tuberosum]